MFQSLGGNSGLPLPFFFLSFFFLPFLSLSYSNKTVRRKNGGKKIKEKPGAPLKDPGWKKHPVLLLFSPFSPSCPCLPLNSPSSFCSFCSNPSSLPEFSPFPSLLASPPLFSCCFWLCPSTGRCRLGHVTCPRYLPDLQIPKLCLIFFPPSSDKTSYAQGCQFLLSLRSIC